MIINKKIQTYIENKGLKLVDISKKMGISKQNFSRILNSDDLKLSQLIDLCKILNVNPSYFFDGSESINNAEIEGYKKRISELEEIISNKNEIDMLKFFNELKEISRDEFKEESDKIKEDACILILGKMNQMQHIISKVNMSYTLSQMGKRILKNELHKEIENIKSLNQYAKELIEKKRK